MAARLSNYLLLETWRRRSTTSSRRTLNLQTITPGSRPRACHRKTSPWSPILPSSTRGKQDALGLDISGFQWVTYPSVEKDFVDKEQIKTVYYAEVEDILKNHAGAKVFIFDHTIRRSAEPQTGTGRVRGPQHIVHADQTPAAAKYCIKYHLPDDTERLSKGRYQIINVWRLAPYSPPIKCALIITNPVTHNPLGVADFRSVDVDSDLVLMHFIYPHREGGTYSVKYNPGHKWYYLSDQNPDEVALIKCFDSDANKTLLTPHSAFSDRTTLADAPHRQSIEVRTLVFDRQ